MARAYRRNTVELTLEQIEGAGPWGKGREGRERYVTASLVWPRPLVAGRISAQSWPFTHAGLDLHGRDWSEKILFKEKVEGPFGLILQISETLSAQQLARMAASIGQAVLQAAGSQAARLVDGPGLSSLAKFPFVFAGKELSQLGKTPQVVAAGRTTRMPGEGGMIEIPLTVPETIVRKRRTNRGGRMQTRTETLHKKGEPAGLVRLQAVYYRE